MEFQQRQKGQRYDESLIPNLCAAVGHKVEDFDGTLVGTWVKLGEFNGYDGFGQPCTFEHIAVTLPSGLIVPAYSKGAAQGWNICQDYSRKAIRP